MLPIMSLQSTTVKEDDIFNQLYYLGRECERIDFSLKEYIQQGNAVPDTLVFDHVLQYLKQMQIDVISSSCATIIAEKRDIFVESYTNSDTQFDGN